MCVVVLCCWLWLFVVVRCCSLLCVVVGCCLVCDVVGCWCCLSFLIFVVGVHVVDLGLLLDVGCCWVVFSVVVDGLLLVSFVFVGCWCLL